MSTHNHTAISSGAAANAATVNTPLGTLDAAIGNLTTLTTTAKTSAVAAINEVDANADAAAAAVGTLASLTTTDKASAVAAINEVDANADAAAAAVGTLASLTTTAKTSAVAAINEVDAEIAALAQVAVNLVLDPFCRLWSVSTLAQDGRTRWYIPASLSTVAADGSGYNANYVRATANGGRVLWLPEMGLKAGDVVSFALDCLIPVGRNARLAIAWRTSGGAAISTVTGTNTAGTGAQAVLTLANQTIPATAGQVYLYVTLVSGSGDVDIYNWICVKATSISASTIADNASANALHAYFQNSLIRNGNNLHPDPFNQYTVIGESWGGVGRWYNSTALEDVDPDAGNPYDAPTRRHLGSGATLAGIHIRFEELGIAVAPGDVIRVAIECKAASGNFAIWLRGRTQAGTGFSNAASSSTAVTMAGVPATLTHSYTVQAGDYGLTIATYRTSGSADLDIYSSRITLNQEIGTRALPSAAPTWLYRDVQTARGDLASLAARLDVSLNADGTPKAERWSPYVAAYGRDLLRDWQAKLARIRRADGTSQAVIAWIGDSWIENDARLTGSLRSLLQTEYGDAGPGYVSAVGSLMTGVSRSITGTWTQRDKDTSPIGRGVDMYDATSTDTATPAKISYSTSVLTWTSAKIHYIKQVDGGEFRWRVDAGAWTTVNTAAGAEAHAVETISGLAATTHTLEIEVLSAGVAGVKIAGVELIKSGNGVRLLRLGQNGATADEFATAAALGTWAGAVQAFAPNMVILTLGTNDHNQDYTIASFTTYMNEIVDSIQAAMPLCDVLIATPGDNGNSGTYTIEEYVDALRDIAIAQGCAGFDMLLALGDCDYYVVGAKRNLWEDASHINATAGRIVDGLIYENLLRLP